MEFIKPYKHQETNDPVDNTSIFLYYSFHNISLIFLTKNKNNSNLYIK